MLERLVRPRVLVVDDQLSMAEALAEGLAENGYDAQATSSSQTAMQRISVEPFDAVVTDLRMPGADGLTLLAHARKLDRDRPVIVMTAYSAVDSAIESIRCGAYHYLTKPFKIGELVLFLGPFRRQRRRHRRLPWPMSSLMRAMNLSWR